MRPPGDPRRVLARLLDHLVSVQDPRGCWAGEVQWCPVLLAQWVIVGHAIGRPPDPARAARAIRHFEAWRTPEGGWGLHAESPACLFVTALGYVALRLLGVRPDAAPAAAALAWIRSQGGVEAIPTWGKLWLAMLGLYGWEGVHPMPPEPWLLPESSPVHPRRMYNHTRLIYLAMAWLYGRRLTVDLPLRDALRAELFVRAFDSIDFRGLRHLVAATDLYEAPSAALRAAFDALALAERSPFKPLRAAAMSSCLERIRFECRSTNWACVSPVNGLLNVLALWAADPSDPDAFCTYEGMDYWAWEDEAEGLRFNGAHSHTWDTAFVLQALAEVPAADRTPAVSEAARRACLFLRDSQMRDEIPDRRRWHRDSRLGGWCFSDAHHRWPVSDCTAEAASALLAHLDALPGGDRIEAARLAEAAEFVLTRRNPDGGFGSYEAERGGRALLDRVNPTEMFGNCMTERSYVECTASCVAGLARLRDRLPDHARERVDRAVRDGVECVLRQQRPDGAWAGFWGVHFTYGTWYAIEGLRAAGLPADHSAIRRACAWLLAHRKPDGGWGESWRGPVTGEYAEHERSQVIMTSWALLALLAAGNPDPAAADRAAALIASRQLPDGSMPKEGVGGVFFQTAMHHYCLYKDCFAAWALARWVRGR